jgi:hypothetical protein
LIGSVSAIFLARWYERASGGRQSFIVWVLFLDFVIAVVVMTIFGAINLAETHKAGISITKFGSLCKK